MGTNAYSQEVLSIPGIPDTAGNLEAIVADVLSFIPAVGTVGTLTTTLVRKPAGSAASVVSNGVTFDVAGLYQVSVLNAGYTRNINVYVFPASVLTQAAPPFVPVGNTQIAKVTRGMLRQLVTLGGASGGAVSLATMAASLEAATPTIIGVLGAGVPVSFLPVP